MSHQSDSDLSSGRDEVTGVFKSAGYTLQKINPVTNSAVSDVAVERMLEAEHSHPDPSLADADNLPTLGPAPAVVADPVAAAAAAVADELRASVAKADAAVQFIEERQAALEGTYQKAEMLLSEVARVSAALDLTDDLRQRIESTIRRTRMLRESLK